MKKQSILAIVAAIVALATCLHAADIYWTGAAQNDDSWNTPENWKGDHVPGDGDRARFDNDYVVQVDDDIRVGSINVSDGKFPVFQGSGSITVVNGSITGGKGAQYNVPVIFPNGVAATASSANQYGSTIIFNRGLSGGASVYTGGNQNYGFRLTNGVVSVPMATINCGAHLKAAFTGDKVTLTDTWADSNGNSPSMKFYPGASFGASTELASGIGVPTVYFSNEDTPGLVHFDIPVLRIGEAGRPTFSCELHSGTNLVNIASVVREPGSVAQFSNNKKSGTFTPGENAGFVIPTMPVDAQGLCPVWVFSDVYRVRKLANNALAPLSLNDYTKINDTNIAVDDPTGLYRIDYTQHSVLTNDTSVDSLFLRGNFGTVDDNLMTLDLGDHDLRLHGTLVMYDYASKSISASGDGRLVFGADHVVFIIKYDVNLIEVSAPIAWEKPAGSAVTYPDFLLPYYSGAQTIFSGEDRVGDWGGLFAEGRGRGGSLLIFDGPSDRTFHGPIGGRFWMRKRGSGTLTFGGPERTRGTDIQVEEGAVVIAHDEAPTIKGVTNGAIVRVAENVNWTKTAVVRNGGILEGFGTLTSTHNHNQLFDGCILRGGTSTTPGTLSFGGQVVFPTNIVLDVGFKGDTHGQISVAGKQTFRSNLDTVVRVRVSDIDGNANIKRSDTYLIYSWRGTTENYSALRVSFEIENATPRRLDTSRAEVIIDTTAKTISITGLRPRRGTVITVQ